MTGLNNEQLTDLVARLHELCGDKFVSAGPPLALGLFRSVALALIIREGCRVGPGLGFGDLRLRS
jgi:hypothetical protein